MEAKVHSFGCWWSVAILLAGTIAYLYNYSNTGDQPNGILVPPTEATGNTTEMPATPATTADSVYNLQESIKDTAPQ